MSAKAIPINRPPVWSDADLEQHGLPCAPVEERMVLGSLLCGWADVPAVLDALVDQDFSTETNRRILRATRAVYDRGAHVDHVTVGTELRDRRELESVGGLTYLTSLTDGIPQLPDLTSYLRTVKEKGLRRRIIWGCQVLINRCASDPEHATDVLQAGEKLLADLSQESAEDGDFVTVGQVVQAAGGTDAYVQRARQAGLMSGWSDLDFYTHGFLPGELVLVGGLTSSGKSAFVQNLALHWAKGGHPGAMFSTEMSREENSTRLACIESSLDHLAVRRGEVLEFNRALGRVAALPVYLYDRAYITLPKIAAGLRRLKARRNIEWAVVDYLQQLSSTQKSENRTQEVSAFSRGLKLIAQDLKIPIVAVSQLSRRPGQEHRKPDLSDLRDSGSLEQDANTVLFVHPTGSGTGEWCEAEILLRKQRSGPKNRDLPMLFHGPSYRFAGRATDESE